MPKGGNGNGGNGNGAGAKPPKITDQAFGTAENPINGYSIGVIEADVSPNRSSWSILSGNDDDAFAIDPQTGELYVADGSAIDYETETEQTRNLIVQVTENGKKSYSATVTINLSDVNETPSAGDPVEATVAETVDSATVLATVSATDPDTLADDADPTNDAFNDLTYAITNGDPNGLFDIDAEGNTHRWQDTRLRNGSTAYVGGHSYGRWRSLRHHPSDHQPLGCE